MNASMNTVTPNQVKQLLDDINTTSEKFLKDIVEETIAMYRNINSVWADSYVVSLSKNIQIDILTVLNEFSVRIEKLKIKIIDINNTYAKIARNGKVISNHLINTTALSELDYKIVKTTFEDGSFGFNAKKSCFEVDDIIASYISRCNGLTTTFASAMNNNAFGNEIIKSEINKNINK